MASNEESDDDVLVADELVGGSAGATAAKKKNKKKKKKAGGKLTSMLPRGVSVGDNGDLIWDDWAVKVLGKDHLQQWKKSIKSDGHETQSQTVIKSAISVTNNVGSAQIPDSENTTKDTTEGQADSEVTQTVQVQQNPESTEPQPDPTQPDDDEWRQTGTKMRRRQKQYIYSGELRPAKVTKQVKMPESMLKPDYADHPQGYCMEEQQWPDSKIPILKDDELLIMREACRLGREILDIASKYMCVGVTGDQIDKLLTAACIERNIYPSPLNYYNFPKSVCVSANEVICHGIPDMRPFKEGDIVNLDVSIFHQGYHSDLNETFFIGKCDESSERLVKCAYECLQAAAQQIKPGTLYRSLGTEITKVAQTYNCSVVSAYCGHGINKMFHCPPQVPHYKGSKVTGTMKAGHIFTVEPMINWGPNNSKDGLWLDEWTAVTLDGGRSAQFEHTFLVTENGYELLTARDYKVGEPMPNYNRGWFQR